jgi:serine protease
VSLLARPMREAPILLVPLLGVLAACGWELDPGPDAPAAPALACQDRDEAAARWTASGQDALASIEHPFEAEQEPGRYIVHFEAEPRGGPPPQPPGLARRADGVPPAQARLLELHGARVLKGLGPQNAVVARMHPGAAAMLAFDPEVARVEEDPQRRPFGQERPWSIDAIGAPAVWAQTGPAVGARVCVIDSGLYRPHEDLQLPWVFGYPAGWEEDRCGHGTHVAGTIAALDNETGVVGVNPRGVDLFVVRVFDDECSWSYASELVDALNRCRAADARVVNLSLGGPGSSELERKAFEDAWRQGLLVVAAAGNSGSGSLEFPASYPSVLSVGAVDQRLEVASFSQKNALVDLVAPGAAILSTVGTVSRHQVSSGETVFFGNPIERSGETAGIDGELADGGGCLSSGSWLGKLVVCRRGTNTFAEKVEQARRGGAAGVIIYNDASGPFAGTLGKSSSTVPAIALSGTDGEALLRQVGRSGQLVREAVRPGSGYRAMTGTSMAAPHVAGAAALLWGQHPASTNAQVRAALQSTARDLGPPGRDLASGHGLIQANAAHQALGEGVAPGAPFAGFSWACAGRQCSFRDTSLDPVGRITARTFQFGDGRASSFATPAHRYEGPGPYTVRLQVHNERGQRTDLALPVSVIDLEVQGGPVVDGRRKVALRWSGVAGERVLVLRDGKRLAEVANTGAVTDTLDGALAQHGASYRVCEPGAASCSSPFALAPLCPES